MATEMGDGEFGARQVVGGTGQYTGGGIWNSLIGKVVVALNDMFGFGYSSQLCTQKEPQSANVVCLYLCKV